MITPFYLYDPSTGRIVQTGMVPAAHVAAQQRDGLRVGYGTPDITSQYVDLRDGTVVNMPPRPSTSHEFDYKGKSWQLNTEHAWETVRAERDRRLTSTDWVVLRAADQGAPVPPEWLAYRQALRGVTTQPDPCSINWPEPPLSA